MSARFMRDALIAMGGSSPLVLDSPHSGTCYPHDFGYACDLNTLRGAEDTHVERLFDFAPSLGAALVHARFPRSYIDANRALDEIDPELLASPWPGPLKQSDKVKLGKGLIWRLTDEGAPIYGRRLSVEEVTHRIDACWRPYYAAVEHSVEAAWQRHGYVIHLNCHSMPSVAGSHATQFPGMAHPDFVIGDRDGTSADPALGRWIVGSLRDEGFDAVLNTPYKGVELVRRYGDPARHRHSVQIEINRRLYMNETTREPHEGFEGIRDVLRRLVARLASLDLNTSFGIQS
jgi:N-formylglutamate deformylase